MAERGSKKARSVEQEDKIASLYGGKRSPSSGGAATDQGDVRSDRYLIECKMSGGPGAVSHTPKFVSDLEKVTEEAWSEGRTPMLALRYFDPESILADREGWIDLIVKRVIDDTDVI
jgi:hypothetical protein